MGKTNKFISDWWGIIVTGGGVLVALFTLGIQMIDFDLITLSDEMARNLYIIASIIFIVGILIQVTKPQKELIARRRLNPKIIFENKYELEEILVNITVSNKFLNYRDTQTMGSTGEHFVPTGESEKTKENHLYLILYIKNLPDIHQEESAAKNLQVSITFNKKNGKEICEVERGRWWEEGTKLYPESYISLENLCKVNIAPGEEKRMVLTFINLDKERNMYAFAYNSHQGIYRKGTTLLGKEPLIAQLSFWGDNLNPTKPIEIGLIPKSNDILVIYPFEKKLLRKDYSARSKDG